MMIKIRQVSYGGQFPQFRPRGAGDKLVYVHTCSPSTPKILGSDGPQMSISRTPTLKARAAKQRESIEVTVDLPKNERFGINKK